MAKLSKTGLVIDPVKECKECIYEKDIYTVWLVTEGFYCLALLDKYDRFVSLCTSQDSNYLCALARSYFELRDYLDWATFLPPLDNKKKR